MKSTKIVTPVLLFLLLILLAIAIYMNFVYKPLSAKVDQMSFESDLLKTQRLEIEMAMMKEKEIKNDIAEIKDRLEENEELALLDGEKMPDDIYARAVARGIQFNHINISGPDFADTNDTADTVLLFTTANLGFNAGYDSGVDFIESIETSTTGAYEVQNIAVSRPPGEELLWNIELRLYHYGHRNEVPPAIVESQGMEDKGIKDLVQQAAPGAFL